jgi:hypothetical protein
LPRQQLVEARRLGLAGAAVHFERHGQVLRGHGPGVPDDDRDGDAAVGVRDAAGVGQIGDGDVSQPPLGVAAADDDESPAPAQLLGAGTHGRRLRHPARLLQVAEEVDFLVRPRGAVERRFGLNKTRQDVTTQARQRDGFNDLSRLVEVGRVARAEDRGAVGAGDDLHGRVSRQVVENRQRRGLGSVEACDFAVGRAHAEAGVEDQHRVHALAAARPADGVEGGPRQRQGQQ